MKTSESGSSENQSESWEFAGWGKAEHIQDLETGPIKVSHLDQVHKHQLGTWRSTAICGNDISSSVLYVSALCAAQAGALAPVVLLVVALVLYLFRKVYAEVGSALPLNGGTYTVLLNTTNKQTAAAAACLTLLSYIATAVISAGEAMHYGHNLVHGLDVMWATIGLLGVFALLNILGISESAVVALVIFIFHLLTLSVLAVSCTIAIVQEPTLFFENWKMMPDFSGLGRALFLGFAAAMLGISGFESSANFIEEQKRGVFPKTLKNMWVVVAIFNPLISLLSLGLLPLATIQQVPPDLLADMGTRSMGAWLGTLVSIDAFLVLSGAVLTSYVGVTGLVRRMSLDRCLPQFLLKENRMRKTNHWIILGFFVLCVSILEVTQGKIETLAGVYTLSFLSVMALFAIGNMLLKYKRSRLPRETRAGWMTVSMALMAVLVGIIGNVVIDPLNVEIFLIYFVIAVTAVGIMFLRIEILKLGLSISRAIVEKVNNINEWIRTRVLDKIKQINSLTVVYFTRGDDLAILNRAALYVLKNEQTTRLKVVHMYENEEEIAPDLDKALTTIDHMYPQLRIDYVLVKGRFNPETIERLSRRLKVPKNYMFIGTPGDSFSHRIEKLGGVRVIV